MPRTILGVAYSKFGHTRIMAVLALVLVGWLLVCLLLVAICVAMRRDDEALDRQQPRGVKHAGSGSLKPRRVA
jgi:hypothetical protein